MTEECQDIRALLSVVIDGEANEEEQARAEGHTAVCAGCASHLAFLRATETVWRQLPVVAPPASLAERVAARTYARPSLWRRLTAAFELQPVRLTLVTAVSVGVIALIGVRFSGEKAPTIGTPVARVAPSAAPAPLPNSGADIVRPAAPTTPVAPPVRVAMNTASKPESAAPSVRELPSVVTTRATERLRPSVMATPRPASPGVPTRSLEARSTLTESPVAAGPRGGDDLRVDAPVVGIDAGEARSVAVAAASEGLASHFDEGEGSDGAMKVSWREFAANGDVPLRTLRAAATPRADESGRLPVVDAPVSNH